MKTTLLSIYKAIFLPIMLFFVPIYMMVFLVGLSTLIDTAFGIWKSNALKEKVSSKKCRKGLVPKLKSYVIIILLLYTADFYIVNELTHLFIDIDYVATKLVAFALIIIEVKSMDESFEAVKGYSFIAKVFSNIKNIKKVKDDLQP